MTRRALLAGVLPPLAGCGYRVAGRSDLLPKTLHTIAIPAFSNPTTRYRLTERLPAMMTREFIRRTRYEIVSDPNTADAVLTGGVVGPLRLPHRVRSTNRPGGGHPDARDSVSQAHRAVHR